MGEKEASERLLGRTKSEFWSPSDGVYTSSPGEDGNPMPSIIACFLGILPFHEGKKVLSRIRQDYMCSFGIKTRSHYSREHRAGEPGLGAVSLVATIMGAGAFLNYGIIETGLELLSVASNHIYSSYVGRFPEFVSSSRGEPTCHSISVESSALFVRVVDSYLFGILPRIERGRLVVNLSMVVPPAWKRWERFGKPVGQNTMRMAVSRLPNSTDYELELLFEELFDGELRVFPPSWARRVILDGDSEPKPGVLSLRSFKKKRIVFKGP